MPPDDDDEARKAQKEHSSYFGSPAEEEPAETRFDPVTVDLSRPEPKKGGDGKDEPPPRDPAAEELRAQLEQARQQTAYAQRQAQELAQRAQFAERQAMGASVSMIDSALEAAQQQSANASAKFHAALDAADHKMAAEAQREQSAISANILRLQEQKAMVEAEVRRSPPQPQPQRQQPQQPGAVDVNVIARDLVNSGYPRSADWLRANATWASRPDLMKRVSSAHNHLVDNRGFTPETDEYFAALEQELGMTRQQQRANGGGDYSAVQRGQRPSAAAPTSNAQPSLRTGQPQSRSHVTLTPAQREAAELSGMSEREYAKEFEDARVSGKLIGFR